MKITYDELQRSIGRHLGWDRNPSNWSADEITDAADIIKSGTHGFYWPTLEGIPPHKWSFLCVTDTVAITDVATLPDAFIRLVSSFTLASDERVVLRKVTEEQLRRLKASDVRSGEPLYFAVRPKQGEQRYELLLHPVANSPVTLAYQYEFEPEELSTSNTEHEGSAANSQALRYSCLFQADQMLNPEVQSQFEDKYRQAMLAAIAKDQEIYGADQSS